MDERLEKMTIALEDAGCGEEVIAKAARLLEAGRGEELVRHLRLCRCDLMEDLHETQKKVDRMDYLIRQTEKSITVK